MDGPLAVVRTENFFTDAQSTVYPGTKSKTIRFFNTIRGIIVTIFIIIVAHHSLECLCHNSKWKVAMQSYF